MPVFQYVALDVGRRKTHGQVDAADLPSAAAAVREKGLFIVHLEAAKRNTPIGGRSATGPSLIFEAPQMGLRRFLPVTTRDHIFFLQHLSLMVRTGTPLVESLAFCSQEALKPRLALAILRIQAAIESGASLSQAMNSQRHCFCQLTVKLVESAEASGQLNVALDQAAAHLKRTLEVRRKMITSMTYPAVVGTACCALTTFLVLKVLPKFEAFFAERQVDLPPSMQLLLDVSQVVRLYPVLVPVVILLIVGTLAAVYLTTGGRRFVDQTVLRLPVVGRVLTLGIISQVSHTLSVLLRNDVTLLDSLRIVSQISGNRAIAGCLARSAEAILKGRHLAGTLRHSAIPSLMPQVVAVGERTGALSQVLQELGEFYDRELDGRVRRMAALLEPVLILVIGGIVGFVFLAVFQTASRLSTTIH